ncbi:MAG: ABC transporter permease [Nitrososphaeria archaeon]
MIKPVDVLRFSFKVLTEKKLRAVLTIIGIAIGPASMITIIGTTQGYSQTILDQLTSLGGNTIVVFPQKGYTISDTTVSYVEGLKGVDSVTPFYMTEGNFKRADGSLVKVQIYATDLDVFLKTLGSLKLEEGTIPQKSMITSAAVGYEIIHTEDGAKLYNVGNAISLKIPVIRDEKLEFKTVSLRVVGAFQKYGSSIFVNPDMTIFLPLSAGKSILGVTQYTGLFIVAENEAIIGSITKQLKDKYRDLVQIIAFQQIAQTVNQIIDTLDFLLFSLSISAFAVAVTGTMATMFTSIIERTKEIGVLKAFGYSSRNILVLILTEGIIMSIIGGTVGIIIGATGAYLLSSIGSFSVGVGAQGFSITAQPAITADLILRSLSMAVFVGTVGGLIPALRASKVPPIVALRYE